MDFLLLGLLVAAIPFVLPIASWVSGRRTRRLVEELATALDEQGRTIDGLKAQLAQLRRQMTESPVAPPQAAVAPAAGAPVVATGAAAPVVAPASAPAPSVAPPPPRPAVERPSAPARPAAPERRVEPPPVRLPVEAPVPPRPSVSPAAPAAMAASATVGAAAPSAAATSARDAPPARPPRTPPPPVPPEPPKPAFDWEGLVGVKLFSGIAGIALVFAAVYFLKYSVEHGWLQPPVRVVIGITVALALLVVCELKAARRYPATANALDAAAIAILFSTFFAAHALWNLIPSLLTFVLLGVVTALAVLLSIRRESLFIAVLGLLGGFATPVLLSTGQNQPIPLFAYLTLLNIGLAWVAYRQTWPLLTTLTLVLTTLYQWGWVFKFLDRSQLTLAMGIFLLFPLTSLVGLILAKRRVPGRRGHGRRSDVRADGDVRGDRPVVFCRLCERGAGVRGSPVAPVRVPAADRRGTPRRGARAAAGPPARRRSGGDAHGDGRVARLVLHVHRRVGRTRVLRRVRHVLRAGPRDRRACSAARSKGRAIARPSRRRCCCSCRRCSRGSSRRLRAIPLFGTLLALVLLIAWRAIATGRGALYYWAAFFAIATQAAWSSVNLTVDRLGMAVIDLRGLRGRSRPRFRSSRGARAVRCSPRGAAGSCSSRASGCCCSCRSDRLRRRRCGHWRCCWPSSTPGMFVESASGGLPLVAVAGSLVSWVVLASWWLRVGAAVGVVPSLAVLTGLSLMTMGGHAWMSLRSGGRPDEDRAAATSRFDQGLYLGLIGHLFLLFVAVNREWSLPPWPWLATLAVLTLASSTLSLMTRATALHAGGVIAAGVVIAAWTYTTGAPWELVALVAAAAASGFALVWIVVARDNLAAAVAAALLFLGELTAIILTAGTGAPPFAAIVITHVVNLAVLLALTWTYRWRQVALWAVLPACIAAAAQWADGDLRVEWVRLLVLAFAMYAVFTAYPIVVGRRARGERDPYLTAVLAQRDVLLRGARRARRRRVQLDGRSAAGVRGRRDGAPAAPVAADRANRPARSRAPGARGGLGARLRHRGDPAAAPAPVDHDRVGARRCGAGVAVSENPASRAALFRARPAGRRVRAPGDESGGADLRASRRAADLQLVSLRLRDLRGGAARGRVVAVQDRRSRSRGCRCGRRRCCRRAPSSCCSGC